MQTAIGQHFQSSTAQRLAVAIGVVTVVTDYIYVTYYYSYDVRCALALIAFAAIIYLADGNLSSLGLRLTPQQGWRPWVRNSLIIGLLVSICFVLGTRIWLLMGCEIPQPKVSPFPIFSNFLRMCFVAPVMEEAVYRVIICVSLMNYLGPWKTIIISGLLF